MIRTKRSRDQSRAGTPSLGHSEGLRTSSEAQSSPIRQLQYARLAQQQPNKRVSSHPVSGLLSPGAYFPQQRSAQRSPRSPSSPRPEDDYRPEDEASIKEREETDSLDETVMCVDMRDRGTVGCCYYVARDEKLFVMVDVAYGGIEVISTCKPHTTMFHSPDHH